MTLVEALQAALAVEQEVVYGYGVVGARSRGASRRSAYAALRAHQQRRDDIAGYLRAAGVQPSPPAPGYVVPFDVIDQQSAGRLGAVLEQASAGAAWDLVAAAGAGSEIRQWTVDRLAATARWLDQWRLVAGEQSLAALPGQPG